MTITESISILFWLICGNIAGMSLWYVLVVQPHYDSVTMAPVEASEVEYANVLTADWSASTNRDQELKVFVLEM